MKKHNVIINFTLISLIFVMILSTNLDTTSIMASVSQQNSEEIIVIKAPLTDGIWIHNDAELIAASSGGIGTPADPYLIKDLVINTTDTVAIRIEDTTLHFEVVNCTVTASWGIYLDNITSSTAKIRNNTAINCDAVGIYLYHADATWIQENILLNNGRGIEIRNSLVVFINNNYISSQDTGIYIYRSNYASLTDNEMYGDGIGLNFNNLDDLLSLAMSTCTVNSKPILFSKSESDSTISTEYGQIIIINGSNINIVDQSLTNVDQGMIVWYGKNIDVSNCYFSSGDVGIQAYVVDNLVVSDCEFENLSDGIYTGGVINNNFYQNNFEDNTNGISVSESGAVKIHKNNFYNNTQVGVYIDDSVDCIIYWNNFTDNGDDTGYQAYDGGIGTLWYNNITMTGNWWSDYSGTGNYTIQGNPDNNYDLYPLAEPFSIIPEFPVSFWLIFASVSFLTIVIPVLRKRK